MAKEPAHYDAGIRKVRISLTSQEGQVLEAPHITDLSGVPRILLGVIMAHDFVHLSWTFKRDGETLTYDIQRMVEPPINLFAQEPRDKMVKETAVDGLWGRFVLNCGHSYRYAYRDQDLAEDVSQLALGFACHCVLCEESGSAYEEAREAKE